ncbi:MAG: carbon-nitrogen hydrolase family protein [Sphaerochaeta sp.]|nr:carbon-nitrogen hydrolase family protein [Sphaerochaeta sp.]
MRIFALELDNDVQGVAQRKAYIESLIATLDRPDLVVLPELALCRYIGNDSIWEFADENSHDASKWAREIASKYGTYVAVGYVEKTEGDMYNSYLIADASKVYGIVRKSEGESYIVKRGDFLNIITTPFGEVAVGICYDARRRSLYENIKDRSISLIIFPHGSPSDPHKKKAERDTNDFFCNAYADAFQVPVCYVNSIGEMGFMLGQTGKMMTNAGFRLNGLSKIYCSGGTRLETNIPEAIGMDIALTPHRRTKAIKFYGDDIQKGNFLFRQFVLKPDIKKGVRFYEERKDSCFV